MPANVKLATYLKQHRQKKGITQPDLAKALRLSSAMSISNFEKAKAPVPLKHLKKLVKILDLNPKQVIRIIQDEREKELQKLLKVR